jgi:hypothetical protein
LLILSTACGQNATSESPTTDAADTIDMSSEDEVRPAFELMIMDMEHPFVEGNIVDRKCWTDRIGTWCCVWTETIDTPNEFAEFRLYKFKEDSILGLQLSHLYLDSMSCGEADIVTRSDTKQLIITDINNDEIGEVTFAYTLSCTYDISPQRRVLVVNLDTIVYKLVGFTLDYGAPVPDTNDLNLEQYPKDEAGFWFEPTTAGRYTNDNDFESLPDIFLIHAKNVWLDILRMEYQQKQKEMND